MDRSDIEIIKGNGQRELFKVEKLEDSLRRSGAGEPEVEQVVAKILAELEPGMKTAEIYTQAFELLKVIGKRAARSYSLRQAVLDLGPTGYPFEDLVAELLKTQGYIAQTRVHLQGKCLEHEVDVYAYREDGSESFIVEAKFHNEHGLRSDLQVALAAKARFDDIAAGENRDFEGPLPHGAWLITNTKFTSSSLQYGSCAGLNMVGWNHPRDHSLHNMIEDSGLHPITSVTALEKEEMSLLLKEGWVLCRQVADREEDLKKLGFSDNKIEAVMAEIYEIRDYKQG